MAKKVKVKKQSIWTKNAHLYKYAILILPLIIYANSLFNGYTVDDTIVITENEFTTQGLKGIPKILSEDTFLGFFKDQSKSKIVSGGRYRPFSLVMFAIEYQIAGLSPFLGHLVNVLLYMALGWMIFLCLQVWFNKQIPKKQLALFSFIVTMLYIAHPLHTEAVANIKGRDEILALLLPLSAFIVQVSGKFNNLIRSLGCGILFFLALLSKENAITFVIIIPLVYWFLQKETLASSIKKSIPYVIPAILFVIIRTSILGSDLTSLSGELMNNPFLKWDGQKYISFNGSEKLSLITNTFAQYFRLFLFPHPLTHDYYPKHIDATTIANIGSILGLILSFLIGGGIVYWFNKNRILSFALIFAVVTISLVINVLFPIGTIMSERFMFMPSLGLCMIGGFLLLKGINNAKFKKWMPLVFGLILLLFSIKTVVRNFDWKDNYTLFNHDILISKNSAKLNNAVGGEIISRAVENKNEATKHIEINRAITHLNKAILIHPTYKNAYLLLGNAYFHLGSHANAVVEYRKALTIDPNYKDALNNLPVALREAGKEAGEKNGNIQQALNYLLESERLNDKDYETKRLLGVAYGIAKNHDNAIKYFTLAVEIRPDDADALYNLGLAYYNSGNTQLGENYINKAKAINPNIGSQNAN